MKKILTLFVFLFLFVSWSDAQKKMIIGVSESPPFVFTQDNEIVGLNVALWEDIADSLHIDYSYKHYRIADLIVALKNGSIDLAISPLTMTSERLEDLNFSVPVYVSSLAFAVAASEESTLWATLKRFFSMDFLSIIGALFFVILIFGFLVWLFERKVNKDFPNTWKGVFDGIWWSAVTMTTVGYGDKSPKTLLGRTLSIIWMFTAVVVISSFTAGIASSLTVHSLSSDIDNMQDLRDIPTGTVLGSSSQAFLDEFRIKPYTYNNVQEGMDAMLNGSIKAFVYDEPILTYYIDKNNMSGDTRIVVDRLYSDYLGFSSLNYEIIKRINPLLIESMEGNKWKRQLKEYGLSRNTPAKN